jgi:hypothetical protein
VKAALDDAGLKPSDVDGMVTFTIDQNEEVDVARTVGCNDLTFYSAAFPMVAARQPDALLQAAMAVATGIADTVVVLPCAERPLGASLLQGRLR